MSHLIRFSLGCVILAPLFLSGCATNTGTGAVVGGATGAGVGALVGSASGHAGAGAAIGAGVGALTGAVVGNSIDEKNRAIEAQYRTQLVAGRVTKEEVINMTQNHVDEELIINHLRAHGMAYPLSSADIIMLQQYQVSPRVIAVMQEAPPPPAVIVEQAPPPPVVVGGYYYGPRYYRHGYYY
jgi:hypothetical protein